MATPILQPIPIQKPGILKRLRSSDRLRYVAIAVGILMLLALWVLWALIAADRFAAGIRERV